jgi:hypothetical protein
MIKLPKIPDLTEKQRKIIRAFIDDTLRKYYGVKKPRRYHRSGVSLYPVQFPCSIPPETYSSILRRFPVLLVGIYMLSYLRRLGGVYTCAEY